MSDDFKILPPETGPECGTAACFAGWRAIRDQQVVHGFANLGFVQDGVTTMATYASDQFELRFEEANDLFSSDNSISDLKDQVDRLTAPEAERSELAKAKLRETMDDVLAADAVGRWEQGRWFCSTEVAEAIRSARERRSLAEAGIETENEHTLGER